MFFISYKRSQEPRPKGTFRGNIMLKTPWAWMVGITVNPACRSSEQTAWPISTHGGAGIHTALCVGLVYFLIGVEVGVLWKRYTSYPVYVCLQCNRRAIHSLGQWTFLNHIHINMHLGLFTSQRAVQAKCLLGSLYTYFIPTLLMVTDTSKLN